MKHKLLYIQTFGCQMNVHDSEQIVSLLKASGYQKTENEKLADLIMLNTCSIREKAAQKVYSQLGRLRHLKEHNPDLIIGVVGCLAQHLGNKFHKRMDYLDFVCGTHNIHQLPEIIDSVARDRQKITRIDFHPSLSSMSIFVPPRDGQISAFVTIMQGCNNFCAYCVVPYLRGREISRTPADILDEIGRLADAGVMEVTLLGQNVNSYGKTLHDGSNFASLIKKIGEIEGIKRIRFTTSHPRDLSDEMIDCFRTEEKLCAHIHLPVQSGSNRVLALMNRGYTVEDYMQKVNALRKTRPDISITSDMIVGFPGETEKDYQETIDMMEKIRFDSTFSFKYSEREGTAAAKLKNKVPEAEKLRRLAMLQDLQNQHTLDKNTQLLGTRQQVLVEGRSKNTANDLTGRTGSWKIVNFAGPLELKGQTVDVGITEAYVHSLRGRIEKHNNREIARVS